MAATLGYSTARALYNAPVAGTRTSGEPSTSSISRFHLRGRRGNSGSKTLPLKLGGRQGVNRLVSLVRASLNNDSDNVRELASEKAVESGQQFDQDAKKLANGQSLVELDAKAEDASDAASYEDDVREKVVDVASDMAVDNTADVDALALKDAGPIAEARGRNVEDTAEALEAKAADVSDRGARKESSSSNESGGNSGSFFKDQVIKENVLDVASDTAVDEAPDVEKLAQKDAADMTGKIGGDQRRNKMTIEGMADKASKLEADRSGSEIETGVKKSLEEGKQKVGRQFEGLTRTISKNLKEGIDASRPTLEELSRTASKGVKAGQENLDYAAEGAAELSGDAREVLDGAKGALDKRLKVMNLAAEEARETGNMVADLATKGWDALTKSTERFLGIFQKNVGNLQEVAQKKAQDAKLKADETAQQAQSKFAETKSIVQAKTDELKNTAQQKTSESKSKLEDTAQRAQSKFNEAKDEAQTKTDELKGAAQGKASESKSKLEDTAEVAKSKAGELSSSAKETADDVKDTVESKAGAEKDSFVNAVDKMKDFERKQGNDQFSQSSGSVISQTPRAIGQTPSAQGSGQFSTLDNDGGGSKGPKNSVVSQTPGSEASVQYSDSGKVNDEWKSKSQ